MCDKNWPLPGEKEKAQQALAELNEPIRGFYSAEYVIYASPEEEGKFAGLACKVCNRWIEYGHADDCPVKGLEGEYIDVSI